MCGELAYIELGGNIGDTIMYFDRARKLIEEQIGKIVKLSSVYQTAPWGFEARQTFLNQVLAIDTNLNPDNLLKQCLQIEEQMGRKRTTKGYISRNIDIDILLWENKIIDQLNLKIPHPLMAERRFVLEPMNEIAPDIIHPVAKKTISQLLEICTDQLECKKLEI
jgi:2-amino-4-hydroxy-6-hydroxymethyldihydropteridine diphosphokinase